MSHVHERFKRCSSCTLLTAVRLQTKSVYRSRWPTKWKGEYDFRSRKDHTSEEMLTEQEQQFLETLYAKYAQTLLRCSQSILLQFPDSGALAEECVQETFEVAMRKMKKLLRHEAPEAWLKDTCRKISLTKRRNLLIHARILGTPVSFSVLFDAPDPADDIEAWAMANDLASVKQSLLSKLSNEERAVYHLFYEQHLSMKETAGELNISKDAVRGALQRIRKKS